MGNCAWYLLYFCFNIKMENFVKLSNTNFCDDLQLFFKVLNLCLFNSFVLFTIFTEKCKMYMHFWILGEACDEKTKNKGSKFTKKEEIL